MLSDNIWYLPIPSSLHERFHHVLILSFQGMKGDRGEPGIGLKGEPGPQGDPGKR